MRSGTGFIRIVHSVYGDAFADGCIPGNIFIVPSCLYKAVFFELGNSIVVIPCMRVIKTENRLIVRTMTRL